MNWYKFPDDVPANIGLNLVWVRSVVGLATWLPRQGKWKMKNDDVTEFVTHWMPLPEPPQ